jgi:hypothetical protein
MHPPSTLMTGHGLRSMAFDMGIRWLSPACPDIQPAAWAKGQFEDLGASHFKPWAQIGVELVFWQRSKAALCQTAMVARPDQSRHWRGDHGHCCGMSHLQHPGQRRTQSGRLLLIEVLKHAFQTCFFLAVRGISQMAVRSKIGGCRGHWPLAKCRQCNGGTRSTSQAS